MIKEDFAPNDRDTKTELDKLFKNNGVKLNYKCKKGTKSPDTNECVEGESIDLDKFSNKLDIQDQSILDAIKNTKGVKLSSDGIEFNVIRYQKPEQDGQIAIRKGVFYLPEKKSPFTSMYKGKTDYGGNERHEKHVVYKNPLFIEGESGGDVPKYAYNMIMGDEEAYDILRNLSFIASSRYKYEELPDGEMRRTFEKLDDKDIISNVSNFLIKNGGDPTYAEEIYKNSGVSNQLSTAMIEHVIAEKVESVGYDSIIGYTKHRGKYRFSEIFDLKDDKYPSNKTSKQNEHINLNYKCPKGTVDESNRCPDTGEKLITQKVDPLQDEFSKFKSSKEVIDKIVSGSPRIKDSDRPTWNLGDIDGMADGLPTIRKVDWWRRKKDNVLELAKSDIGIIAKLNGREVGYISMLDKDSTEIAVVKEHQGEGIGKELAVEFIRQFPEMLYKTGGLTVAGERTIRSAVKHLFVENMINKPVKYVGNIEDFNNSETTKKYIDVYREEHNVFDRGNEDRAIEDYMHERGFDKLPKTVSRKQLDKVVEKGGIELFRGTSREFAKSMESSDKVYVGTGIHGSGIYTAYGTKYTSGGRKKQWGKETAEAYASEQKDGVVVRMSLAKDAKIIRHDLLENEMYDYIKEMNKDTIGYDDLKKASGKKREELTKLYEEDSAKRHLLTDPGRFAVIKGYDAIDIPDLQFMIVLNRGKLITEKVGK